MIAQRGIFVLMAILGLAGCAPPPVPEVTYYHLPPAAAVTALAKPLSALPVEVGIFRAEGVYAEQAVLYALASDSGALRAYHYQMWSDPPARGLQDRLVHRLREAGVAPLVTDRLPASVQALRINGRILHYERVQEAAKVSVRVEFEMRIEQDSGEPLLEKSYAAQETAADTSMAATSGAFGAAIDAAFARFVADFLAMQEGKP